MYNNHNNDGDDGDVGKDKVKKFVQIYPEKHSRKKWC